MTKILFLVDSSSKIGSGHLMRCITLAKILRDNGGSISFICGNEPGNLNFYLRELNFDVTEISSVSFYKPNSYFRAIQTAAKYNCLNDKFDIIVIDDYRIDVELERLLRSITKKIMVIDDMANRKHDCDILLDQNYYTDLHSRYDDLVSINCKKLLGPSWAILKNEFLVAYKELKNRTGEVNRILIFMGGTDYDNETYRVIEEINVPMFSTCVFDVVLGKSNQNTQKILDKYGNSQRYVIHIQTTNMAKIIANADVGIGAGGSSMWERCLLGLPTITVSTADNQYKTAIDVAKTGSIHFLGKSNELQSGAYLDALSYLIKNPKALKLIELNAQSLVPPPTGNLLEVIYT